MFLALVASAALAVVSPQNHSFNVNTSSLIVGNTQATFQGGPSSTAAVGPSFTPMICGATGTPVFSGSPHVFTAVGETFTFSVSYPAGTFAGQTSVQLAVTDGDTTTCNAGGNGWQGTVTVPSPTVTINQAAGQSDPTSASPITFTVVFSESVTGFDGSDVVLSGSAGATTAVVSGSGATYSVAVSGMTSDGTVAASIPAGAAVDADSMGNQASTSSDNVVTFDTTGSTVTINQATAQADPANASPINFTVVFNEPVTGFDSSDIALAGSAGATTASVSGSGAVYNVAVSGMSADGTVSAMIAAAAAVDAAGNASQASTSTDNTVTFDGTAPTVTIDQAAGQVDPTGASPINFSVVFSEAVSGFDGSDVVLSGSAGASTAVVSGSGTSYTVSVSGMSADGTVIAAVAVAAAFDAAGNSSQASTSSDNTVMFDGTSPTVTIDQAAGQADPTATSPINFTVVFSEAVTGFDGTDVVLSGSAGASTAVVSGSGTSYVVTISGMTSDGTVSASIPAGAALDAVNNPSQASTSSDNVVTFDTTGATVSIDQAAGQADPTNASPVNFTVVFSEPVTGFDGSDVVISGTAGATTAVVSGSGANYNVALSGMSTDGTVVATVPSAAATDAAGNPNQPSTSTDNSVVFDSTAPTVTIDQAAGQTDPTGASPISFSVVFSESVTGFDGSDVVLSGSAGATTAVVSGTGASYTVAVSGMSADGTVIAAIQSAAAIDTAGNPSQASTSSDNTVVFDSTGPTVAIDQAAGQSDPTGTSPINFTVVFSEPVTGFDGSDVLLSGSAGATTAVVSGTGASYTVAVSGMSSDGTVSATVAGAAAIDASGNSSQASTSTDNTVVFDSTGPSVAINQAGGQADPTNTSPINFTVVFSEPVTGFDGSDVVLTGSAGATTAVVSGSGASYNVSVSGMGAPGTVVASVPANVAFDSALQGNFASSSTDNTVAFDNASPTVTINQSAGQSDPTAASPISFTVVFSEPVTGFDGSDVVLSGSAGATTAIVSGSGPSYTVAVSGMSMVGTVVATVPAGAALDASSNANLASTSSDNSVNYDAAGPTVVVSQAAGQADPTGATPIRFTVVFSEPVTGFGPSDVVLLGTAGPRTSSVSGSGTTYTVAVSGMVRNGNVTVAVAAGAAFDASGNASLGSTSTDATVSFGGAALAQPAIIPTLSHSMLVLLAGLMLALGAIGFRKH